MEQCFFNANAKTRPAMPAPMMAMRGGGGGGGVDNGGDGGWSMVKIQIVVTI